MLLSKLRTEWRRCRGSGERGREWRIEKRSKRSRKKESTKDAVRLLNKAAAAKATTERKATWALKVSATIPCCSFEYRAYSLIRPCLLACPSV